MRRVVADVMYIGHKRSWRFGGFLRHTLYGIINDDISFYIGLISIRGLHFHGLRRLRDPPTSSRIEEYDFENRSYKTSPEGCSVGEPI